MRSGTHLTIDLLRRQFAAFRSWKRPLESLDSLYLPVDVLLPVGNRRIGVSPASWTSSAGPGVRSSRRISSMRISRTCRQSQPAVADWLDQRATFLHVTRDLRQVLPSLWAFLPDWQGTDPVPFDEAFVREWAHELRITVNDGDPGPGCAPSTTRRSLVNRSRSSGSLENG